MFIKAYKPLVINLVTGPRAIDIEISLLVMLARDLAGRALDWKASVIWLQSASILPCGTSNMPLAKSMLNPSQFKCWVGIHSHLSVCSIKPVLFKLRRTCWLASSAASLPLTDTIPSSQYIIARRPRPRQYLFSGLSSLVNK